mgnify:CR=1 FL=1
MDTITTVLIGIVALFFILLALKNIFNLKKLCVICVSITLAWVVLLTSYFLNLFTDKIIISIIIGHTSLGLFYLLEKKVGEKFKVFRMPLLLTFILAIYSILESFSLNSFIFLVILWFLFFIIYIFRTKKTISNFFNKILECCKKW